MILNYRTIGSGLENRSHQKVKENLLVRSSYFTERTSQLTTEHLTIFDLRSKDEVAVEPEINIDNSDVKHYYAGGDFASSKDNKMDLKYAVSNMQGFYATLAVCPEIKAEIQDIVRNPRPALIHCTAGKDRTGVSSALLMELLDFERSVIYADYLTIDQKLIGTLEQKFVNQFKIDITDDIRKLFSIDKSYLDAFYAKIFDEYETMENYIETFLQLTSEEIENFRAYYLEK